jgi:hypothetical protein
MTRPWHSLSTLRGLGRPSAARKTRFPLLATLQAGIGYPQDSNERFQTKSSPFLELCLAQGQGRFLLISIVNLPFYEAVGVKSRFVVLFFPWLARTAHA